MERNREQPASEVLRADRKGTKEAQQGNEGMGEANSSHRKNSRGLLRWTHVFSAKHDERASITVPKETGRAGVG